MAWGLPWRGLSGASVAIVTLLLGGCDAATQAIWISSLQPFTGGQWDGGISVRFGGDIMLEQVNANPNLLPGYELKVVWQDALCEPAKGNSLLLENIFTQKYRVFAPRTPLQDLDADGDGMVTTADVQPFEEVWNSTIVNPPPVGILGPGCSGVALKIANIAHKSRLLMLSNTASFDALSDRTVYPSFFRTMSPDTKFNPAWIALALELNQTSINAVIGGISTWGSAGVSLAVEARRQGVTLVGDDLTTEIPGFHGLSISVDSASVAAVAAARLKLYRRRMVLLIMYSRRLRLVLCELYKIDFRSAVYMMAGWHPSGWWNIHDTVCAPSEIRAMITGTIFTRMIYFRRDMNTRLSCSVNMTAQDFQDEWLRRQGITDGDLSPRPEGYTPVPEASLTADSVCTFARTLHQVLVAGGIPLSEVTSRSPLGFSSMFDAMGNTDFEGVSGRVRHMPGSADRLAGVEIQQLQMIGSGLATVDIAEYFDPHFNFLGNANLVFQFPGEVFPAGPAGATSIVGSLASFKQCTGNRVLDMLTNECRACPNNTQFTQSVGACLCVVGFYEDASGQCQPCSGGTFTTAPGSLQCEDCGFGRYAPPGSSTCTFCPRGKFANSSRQEVCHSCPHLQTTSEIASESAAACVCDLGAFTDGNGSCTACPQNSLASGLDSPSITSCHCGKNLYMDFAAGICRSCPPGSSTDGGQGKTSVASCLCESGTFMPFDATRCQPCIDGMTCPKGSSEANAQYLSLATKTVEQEHPKLAAGFWASASAPMSVFECRTATHCPGNRYPGDACALNLVSLACDHCDMDYYWSGSACEKCAYIETTSILFPTLPCVLCPFIIVGLYKMFGDPYTRWGSWQNGIAAIIFIALNHAQTVDIIRSVNVRLLPAEQEIFGFFEVSNNWASVFKLDCAGMQNFKASVIMRGLCPPVIGFFCILVYFISMFVGRLSGKPRMAMDRDRLLNVFGSTMFTFFSAIAVLSLLLFKCKDNPNGTQSLIADLSIICYTSPEWIDMLATAIALMLIYIVGMGSLLIRTVIVAPKYFGDPGFQMRWKFLFIKYRADVYWWSIVFLAKNFLINLAFVASYLGVIQLYFSMLAITIYLSGLVLLSPYRHRVANGLEYAACICSMYTAALLTWHASRLDTAVDTFVDASTGVSIMLPTAVTIGCMAYIVRRGQRWPTPECDLQLAEKDFRDVVENFSALIVLKRQEGAKVLLQLSDWDRVYLRKATRALKADVTDRRGSFSTSRLVDSEMLKSFKESMVRIKSDVKGHQQRLKTLQQHELQASGCGSMDSFAEGRNEDATAEADERRAEAGHEDGEAGEDDVEEARSTMASQPTPSVPLGGAFIRV